MEKAAAEALCRNFRASPFYGRRFWVRPVLDSVCRTGTRLRSSTRIADFHHYMTVRLADAVSLDALVRLLATVPAANTLLADPGMTAPVLPFAPLCARRNRGAHGRRRCAHALRRFSVR